MEDKGGRTGKWDKVNSNLGQMCLLKRIQNFVKFSFILFVTVRGSIIYVRRIKKIILFCSKCEI